MNLFLRILRKVMGNKKFEHMRHFVVGVHRKAFPHLDSHRSRFGVGRREGSCKSTGRFRAEVGESED